MPPLDNAKERLPGRVAAALMLLDTAHQPAVRAIDGQAHCCAVIRHRTLVKRHDDIGTQIVLDLDGKFGGEAVQRTVEVIAKSHPVRVHLTHGRQAEHLKAARIGQDRAIPSHETVQPAQVADEFVTGAQVEMVGVGQHQADAQFAQFARLDGFDSRLCAHRRKDRRGDRAMRRVQHASAGHSLSCQ